MTMRATALVLVALVLSLGTLAHARSADSGSMKATWYGKEFAGARTASGETFDPQGLTAAHPTLPFGTMLLVCDDRCARVKVNDRIGATDAELDVSEGTARAIGLIEKGAGPVQVSRVESPTPNTAIRELPKTGGVKCC